MSLLNPLQEFIRAVSEGFSVVIQPDLITDTHGVSLAALSYVENNAMIMDLFESVKNIDDLRQDVLFVRIRRVLVVQDEERENHFYSIDYWDFLTGPRNSCYDKRSGSERSGLPRATSFELEKRTGCLFQKPSAFSASSSRQKTIQGIKILSFRSQICLFWPD
jgi:hypothetical protein